MSAQGKNVDELARQIGKNTDHVEAVLAGYPNSAEGTTMLDTVNDVAEALGMKLVVVHFD